MSAATIKLGVTIKREKQEVPNLVKVKRPVESEELCISFITKVFLKVYVFILKQLIALYIYIYIYL